MNEEQAVLDFFSQPENLPLALSVAELLDKIRQRMNNGFWSASRSRLADKLSHWRIDVTEDRHSPDRYVGLHLQAPGEQTLFLQPMMEQQMIEGEMRIYFGLMWNVPPTDDKKNLPEIASLREKLQRVGFKNNERFLAWRWTTFYPQRKQFLLGLGTQPDMLLDKATTPLLDLLSSHETELNLANTALREKGSCAAISLDQLRMNLPR